MAGTDTSHPSMLAMVETVWLEEANAGFCLSARDIQLARGWQQAGIPTRVIEHALRKAFARWNRPEAPRGLRFALDLVEAAIDKYRRTHTGASSHVPEVALKPTGTTARGDLEAALVALGKAASQPRVKAALRSGYRALMTHSEAPAHVLWSAVRVAVLDGLEDSLQPDERALLARTLKECEDQRMSATAVAAHRAVARERHLGAVFNLEEILELPRAGSHE